MRDSSGITFYYTHQKRKFDVGILQMGRDVTGLMIIPEKQMKWDIAGYCSKSCTENVVLSYNL